MALKICADDNIIRICEQYMVFVVPPQHNVMKLEISDHPHNTDILNISLRQSIVKIFSQYVKMSFKKIQPQLL